MEVRSWIEAQDDDRMIKEFMELECRVVERLEKRFGQERGHVDQDGTVLIYSRGAWRIYANDVFEAAERLGIA